MRDVLAKLQSAGVVLSDGRVECVGDWSADREAKIWSSSKWLTTAVVLGVGVPLDDPVSRHIPSFSTDDVTVRHCLSLTAGIGASHPSIMDGSITLEECVRLIDAEPRSAPPGTTLTYGGNGFQVAGLAASLYAGRSFGDLFSDLVAGPCGMTATTFGDTKNPWLGGGAVSSLEDLGRFVAAQLSSPHLDEMRRVQTSGCAIAFTPYPNTDRQYGLGLWLDEVEGDSGVLVSSQGMAGCTPWIDLRGAAPLAGALLVESSYDLVYPVYRELVDLVTW